MSGILGFGSVTFHMDVTSRETGDSRKRKRAEEEAGEEGSLLKKAKIGSSVETTPVPDSDGQSVTSLETASSAESSQLGGVDFEDQDFEEVQVARKQDYCLLNDEKLKKESLEKNYRWFVQQAIEYNEDKKAHEDLFKKFLQPIYQFMKDEDETIRDIFQSDKPLEEKMSVITHRIFLWLLTMDRKITKQAEQLKASENLVSEAREYQWTISRQSNELAKELAGVIVQKDECIQNLQNKIAQLHRQQFATLNENLLVQENTKLRNMLIEVAGHSFVDQLNSQVTTPSTVEKKQEDKGKNVDLEDFSIEEELFIPAAQDPLLDGIYS